ncbi:hypothetical protein DQ354_17795 [Arthrobacter sp. AQ5-06]|nr:hypothetical protein DQ354_17795 [Arthrobacter sp. AQ5-06]
MWFVLWTCISLAVCWYLTRRASGSLEAERTIASVLYCYAIPAVLLFLPDAAMGFAVSHVRAFTDEMAPHSTVVDFLVLSGGVALACALLLSLTGALRRRHRRIRQVEKSAKYSRHQT